MRVAAILAAAALLAGVLAAGFLSFADSYSGQTCEASPGREAVCTDTSATLVEENGKWVYGVLAVPIAISLGALMAVAFRLPRGIEWSLAGLALLACLIAIFSVGVFFLLGALLLVAAAATDRARLAPS
ncbi:MAG TPA: hypothetical protein VFS30_00295 [Dehalococcoidia bacterium]|nr:hypothetical protein [Dehalococcoidia bacterium]